MPYVETVRGQVLTLSTNPLVQVTDTPRLVTEVQAATYVALGAALGIRIIVTAGIGGNPIDPEAPPVDDLILATRGWVRANTGGGVGGGLTEAQVDVRVGLILAGHTERQDNPHGVTKAQVGLGAADNVPAAQLRDRATHTGTQSSATIADFAEAVEDAVAGFFRVSGAGITLTRDDNGDTITITVPGGSGGADPAATAEAIEDAVGAAIGGAGLITVSYVDNGPDARGAITVTTTATQNATDAALRDRGTHTGTQDASTVTETATRKWFLPAERTKLESLSAGGGGGAGYLPPHAPAGLVGTYNRQLNIYNLKASNMRRARVGIARALAGEGLTEVVVIGDSESSNYQGDTNGYSHATMWPMVLREQLVGAPSATGVGGTGMVPADMAPTADAAGVDPRWTFAGAWSRVAGVYVTSTAAGATATFTTAPNGVQGTIAEVRTFGSSTAFNLTIDGATPAAGSVTVTNGAYSNGVVTPTGGTAVQTLVTVTGLPLAAHTIVLTRAGAGTMNVLGAQVRKTTGLVVHNLAQYGSRASIWALRSSTVQMSSVRTGFVAAPALVLIALGVNDVLQSPSTTADAVAALATIRGYYPDADVALIAQYQPQGTIGGGTWEPWVAALYTLADTLDVPLIDLFHRSGGYAAAAAAGLMGDATHPNRTANRDQGRNIAAALLDSYGAGGSSVVTSGGVITAADVSETTTRKWFTAAERTKLASIGTGSSGGNSDHLDLRDFATDTGGTVYTGNADKDTAAMLAVVDETNRVDLTQPSAARTPIHIAPGRVYLNEEALFTKPVTLAGANKMGSIISPGPDFPDGGTLIGTKNLWRTGQFRADPPGTVGETVMDPDMARMHSGFAMHDLMLLGDYQFGATTPKIVHPFRNFDITDDLYMNEVWSVGFRGTFRFGDDTSNVSQGAIRESKIIGLKILGSGDFARGHPVMKVTQSAVYQGGGDGTNQIEFEGCDFIYNFGQVHIVNAGIEIMRRIVFSGKTMLHGWNYNDGLIGNWDLLLAEGDIRGLFFEDRVNINSTFPNYIDQAQTKPCAGIRWRNHPTTAKHPTNASFKGHLGVLRGDGLAIENADYADVDMFAGTLEQGFLPEAVFYRVYPGANLTGAIVHAPNLGAANMPKGASPKLSIPASEKGAHTILTGNKIYAPAAVIAADTAGNDAAKW